MSTLYFYYQDKQHLKEHYLDFLTHGGLLFTNSEPLSLGSQVTLHIELPDHTHTINTHVAWISPTHPASIGLAFQDDNESLIIKNHIEQLLNS